jgi:hypothetical protein
MRSKNAPLVRSNHAWLGVRMKYIIRLGNEPIRVSMIVTRKTSESTNSFQNQCKLCIASRLRAWRAARRSASTRTHIALP